MDKKRFNTMLDTNLLKALKMKAIEKDVDANKILEDLLKKYLSSYEPKDY